VADDPNNTKPDPCAPAVANISWLPFDPRDWVQLTPAFGQLKSMVAPTGPKLIANKRTATFFDRCVHERSLELALERDGVYRLFDETECRKLHIRVPLDYTEGCGIEPYYDGHWHARRSGLEKLTAIPVTPAEPVPVRTPPAESPRGEPPSKKRGKRWPKKRAKRQTKKQARRRGPDRYGKSDRALFPEITRRMKEEHLSVEEAAGQLSTLGKIEGRGNPDSRKHRLAKRYRNECGKLKAP